MKNFTSAILFALLASVLVFAQTNARPAFVEDFLDLPAPPPRDDKERLTPRPSVLPISARKIDEPPPDDAPINELIDFWSARSQGYSPLRYGPTPSPRTVERLLDACRDSPVLIVSFINIIPTDTETAEFVKLMYDKLIEDSDNQYAVERAKAWLTLNSVFFIDDLLKKVEKVADKNEYVVNQGELLALARLDWDRALPFLERLVGDKNQPVASTLAKWAFYARAMRENDENDVTKYRRLLQDVVENREILPGARDLALDALVKEPEWDGRDEWYVSLLSDESLYDLRVQGRSFTGLTTLLLYSPPEKYAKMMAALVESKNSTIRLAAAKNLVTLLDHNNEVAVRALLPWLSDPKWLPENAGGRAKLIEATGELKLAEAFPALTAIVMNEPNQRDSAVTALTSFGDPRAVPALKFAWGEEKRTYRKLQYLVAIDRCGGFPAEEKMMALESFLESTSTPEKLADFNRLLYGNDDDSDGSLSMALMLGYYVAERPDPGEDVAALALTRLKALRQKRSVISELLAAIMGKWQNRTMYVERLRQLKTGEVELRTILLMIGNRGEIASKAPSELFAVKASAGFARGIAYCLGGDDAELASVIRQTDTDAIIGALGCARQTRSKLPVKEIGELMASADKLLALAAERYLETEDSLAARTLILAKYPGEARILGARYGFVPDKRKTFAGLGGLVQSNPLLAITTRSFETKEDVFRSEIKSDPALLAVFALLPNGPANEKVVRLYRDKVVYTDYEDPARFRERTLSQKEYDDFYKFIAEENLDAKGPQFENSRDFETAEFVMFGKNGGRRVFFIGGGPKSVFGRVVQHFSDLDNGKMVLRYRLSDKIKGLEVLLADKKFEVAAVWKNGSDLRLLIADMERRDELDSNLRAEFEIENKIEIDPRDYEAQERRRESQRLRSAAVEEDHISWRTFADGSLRDVAAQPAEIQLLKTGNDIPSREGFEQGSGSWQVRSGAFEIRTKAPWSDQPGIYKLSRDAEPIKLKDGAYQDTRTTPDGEWVFASKLLPGGDGAEIVRVNLRTAREYRIAIPAAESLVAIGFVESHNKMLVVRRRIDSRFRPSDDDTGVVRTPFPSSVLSKEQSLRPAAPEYFLVNPMTGAAERVSGEFQPFEHERTRRLQKTGKPDEFWAAIYDEKTNVTSIGRYNAKTFTFSKTNDLPEIKFDSMDFWVDEPGGKAYIVYQTHLLAVPLNAVK